MNGAWLSSGIVIWPSTLEHVPKWHGISYPWLKHYALCWWPPIISDRKTYEEVQSTLETQDQQALLWYRNYFLWANPDKFQPPTINPRNIDAHKKSSVLTIANEEIMKTEQIKLLGVNINENLNFTQHISEICTKASQKVGVLMRLRNLIPCQAKLILYKTAIMTVI